ncbi:hypothetical protein MTR_6g042340 [Medicago truncatula]|uniref:Uncharacterized protein n=1 Tax=Medicago truncatula TaxID=3880 RepID=G7KID5_MEDTR|nr:hypothetical protein MTR_6g042340 [Medicago truncatula]
MLFEVLPSHNPLINRGVAGPGEEVDRGYVRLKPHKPFPFFFVGYNRNNTKCFMFESRKVIVVFDVKKLLRLTDFYPNDFLEMLEVTLDHQLKNYVTNVRYDPKFAKLNWLSDLCSKHVETNKSTASVKRVFSPMKVVKSNLCNQIDD